MYVKQGAFFFSLVPGGSETGLWNTERTGVVPGHIAGTMNKKQLSMAVLAGERAVLAELSGQEGTPQSL